jgi:hypothetical protein
MDLLTMMSKLTERAPEIPVVDFVPVKGKARGQVLVELQTPLTPLLKKSGNKEEKIGDEKKVKTSSGVRLDFSLSETLEAKTDVKEGITNVHFASNGRGDDALGSQPFLQWSNAHIEAMILH